MIDEKKLIDELIERKNKTVILMARHGGKGYLPYHKKMLDMIYDFFIKIIKKQPQCERDIPKKPLKAYAIDLHTPHEWGRCPKCGRFISSGSYAWSYTHNNYCESCGQRIDWSKEKLGKKIQKVFFDEKP